MPLALTAPVEVVAAAALELTKPLAVAALDSPDAEAVIALAVTLVVTVPGLAVPVATAVAAEAVVAILAGIGFSHRMCAGTALPRRAMEASPLR